MGFPSDGSFGICSSIYIVGTNRFGETLQGKVCLGQETNQVDVVVVGTTGGTVVTRGVTGGSGLVTGILGWEPEGGSGVLRLGGEGSDAGLAVY